LTALLPADFRLEIVYCRSMDRDKFYTVSDAAKVLGKGERWVRQLALDGVIEGERTAEGWQLLRSSVHNFRDQNPPARSTLAPAVWPSEAREALARVEALQRELGRLEGRLELTERTESTMREERERLLADLERERERADRMEEELREERSKGFWARLFGR
jgi:hypothetical protein